MWWSGGLRGRWAIGPGQERLIPAGRPSPTPAHGCGAVPVVVPSPAHITEPVLRHTALGQCSRDGLHATVCRHRFGLRDTSTAVAFELCPRTRVSLTWARSSS